MGAPAVRIGDLTSDGGTIIGTGAVASKVLIENMPPAVVGDTLTWPTGQSTTVYPSSPSKVLIGGLPAIRSTDISAGGTNAVKTALKVQIG
jgi:uncharacterized Zn-binding protein involved in type VI secretion